MRPTARNRRALKNLAEFMVPKGGNRTTDTGIFSPQVRVHANRSSRLASASKTLSQTVAPDNHLRPTVSSSTRRATPAVAHRSRDVRVLASGRITLGGSHAQVPQAHRQEGGQEGHRRAPRARH